MYKISYSKPAERYLKKIKDKQLLATFKEAIDKLKLDPYIGSRPPSNNPTGIVLYWIVSLAENTRPCISTGTFVRMIAVKLAPKKGKGTFPIKAKNAQNGSIR